MNLRQHFEHPNLLTMHCSTVQTSDIQQMKIFPARVITFDVPVKLHDSYTYLLALVDLENVALVQ